MEHQIRKIYPDEYPFLLRQIKRAPKHLYIQGSFPPENFTYLCVIGSRNHSLYGKETCEHLLRGLAQYPIAIVSGLAIGIDSLAHETALNLGLPTIAFPGSGLLPEVIYPSSKISLAQKIVENGGALVSQFEINQMSTLWTFPERNRLMAGISKAVLIIEGKQGSGTLGTAEYASQFNRDVMIVPGPIFSDLSYGPHLLMRDGAYPVTSSSEILNILGFENTRSLPALPNPTLFLTQYSPLQRKIIENLTLPLPRDELIRNLGTSLSQANVAISELELRGVLAEEGGMLRIVPAKI